MSSGFPPIFLTRLLLVGLFSLRLCAAPVLAQQRYVVTDLGTLGGTYSSPFGINNSGQVVGFSSTVGDIAGTLHAFLYHNGVMHDLGTLGGPVSQASGINDASQVVGQAHANGGLAFLYSNGVMTNLGTLPSDSNSTALNVNSSGWVVGKSTHSSHPDFRIYVPFDRGFLYRNGVMQDLSALLGGAPSSAHGINDSGQIVGSFNFLPFECGQGRAFLYSGGAMRDLGTLPGSDCGEAIAINDFGQVVGLAAAADYTSPRLFYYNGNGLQDLGSLGPYVGGRPWAINNAGQIVGAFSVAKGTTFAFLYNRGVLTDLNTLVVSNPSWVLVEARGINDSGQIICLGYPNGNPNSAHGFLLTPTVPVLLTEPNSDKAIAFDSATFVRDPFPIVTTHIFSQDRRTRITLFASEVVLTPGDPLSDLTVQAEDAQHRIYSLPVEYVGQNPQFGWPTQIVVRLPDELESAGDIQVSITLRGVASNKGVVRIKPSDEMLSRIRWSLQAQ